MTEQILKRHLCAPPCKWFHPALHQNISRNRGDLNFKFSCWYRIVFSSLDPSPCYTICRGSTCVGCCRGNMSSYRRLFISSSFEPPPRS